MILIIRAKHEEAADGNISAVELDGQRYEDKNVFRFTRSAFETQSEYVQLGLQEGTEHRRREWHTEWTCPKPIQSAYIGPRSAILSFSRITRSRFTPITFRMSSSLWPISISPFTRTGYFDTSSIATGTSPLLSIRERFRPCAREDDSVENARKPFVSPLDSRGLIGAWWILN
jgi:hypothetical protein